MEEYIEQIIMEEFAEKEYEQVKLDFIKDMIERSEGEDSDWNRHYGVGKWAVRYLEMLKVKKALEGQIEKVCKRYWANSSVRRYYIDMCMKKKKYNQVIQILDECIFLDKEYRGLVYEYIIMKKEIYHLQGNREAYMEQLGKRKEIFKKLPSHVHIQTLYKEEKLYDRLLAYVLDRPGLNALHEYENVLKKSTRSRYWINTRMK